MIDHISIAVRDIKAAEEFYTALLSPLGLVKLREWPDAAVGYGPTAAYILACAQSQPKPLMPSTRPRLPAGAPATACPDCVRNITNVTMLPSFVIPTATASRR